MFSLFKTDLKLKIIIIASTYLRGGGRLAEGRDYTANNVYNVFCRVSLNMLLGDPEVAGHMCSASCFINYMGNWFN
jgi:hypothetical protein